MDKTAQDLIRSPRSIRPHVVLLGAGASLAAFPNCDALGRQLPLMNDLVEILGLRTIVEAAGLDLQNENNFEVIYAQIVEHGHSDIAQEIERRIHDYFSGLALPDSPTI